MKIKPSLILLPLLFCSLNAQASDTQEIMNNLYEVEDIVKDYERKINRRTGLATQINNIIIDAKLQVREILTTRNPRNPRGRIDLKLVEVTLNACSSLGSWTARKDCYNTYLSGTKGTLNKIYLGCSNISSNQDSSICYSKSLTNIKNGERSIYPITLEACSSLGSWSSRKSCYTSFISKSKNAVLDVLNYSCSQISSNQDTSTCYNKGLNHIIKSNDKENYPRMIVASCNTLGNWSSRAICYKNGVEGAEVRGQNLKRYVRGCYSMSSDMRTSQCFERSLNAL